MKKQKNIISLNRFLFFFIILFAICNLQFQTLYSQPVQQWVRYYPEQDLFQGIAGPLVLDDSGNVYITGSVSNVPTNNSNGFCTIKYSRSGDQRWIANYFSNNTGGRGGIAIAIDSTRNIFVTGVSYENGDDLDFCTIKYNNSGIQEWIKFYDDTLHSLDYSQQIGVDNAGNIYISGISQISGGYYSFTTIKYSTDGRQIWINAVNIGPGGPGADYVKALLIDDSCNIYISGWGYGPRTLKYDSSGNLIWNNLSPFNGESNSLAIDKFHNTFVAGYVYNNSYEYYLAIKYSSSGTQQWIKYFNPDTSVYPSNYEAIQIAIDSTDNIIVSGFYDIGTGMKFCLVKYSNDGNLIWYRKDTSQIQGVLSYMMIDNQSNVYLTSSNYWSIYDYSYTPLILKFDSSGTLLWKYRDNSAPFPRSITVDRENNIYLAGDRSSKMCTIKYTQLVDVKKISSNIPEDYKLCQNYPNPFNPQTIIEYQIPTFEYVNLFVYNILGQQISILVNKEQRPGIYNVTWDASGFSSGIYFYKIYTKNFIQTKKMVVIK